MTKEITIDSDLRDQFIGLFFAHLQGFGLEPNSVMLKCVQDSNNFDHMINHLLEVSDLKSLWLRFGTENPDFVQEGGTLHFPYILGKRLSSLELKEILETKGFFEHNVYPKDYNIQSIVENRRNMELQSGIHFHGRYLFFLDTDDGICVHSYFFAFDKWNQTREYLNDTHGEWTNGSILFLRQTLTF